MGCRWSGVLACLGLVIGSGARLEGQSAPVVRIAGTVFDSVAMKPLVGATVRLVKSDDPATGRTAVSDSVGRFAYENVPTGIWLASFLHPALDSLRLEPAVLRLELTEAGVVEMPLAIPSPRSLIAAACGPAISAEFGLIIGEVRRAGDESPVAGATVEVEWPEWVLVKRTLVTEQMRRTARTDSTGRYVLCGAPAGSTLRTVTSAGADTSGAVEVQVPELGYVLQDFVLGSVEYVTIAQDSLDARTAVARVRRGHATVRGRVTIAAGTVLPGAVVQVIGSGSQVRANAEGEFVIADAGAGTQTIEARAIGYQPDRRAVLLSDGAATEVTMRLSPRTVQLDTVRVTAGREVPWEIRGIERRWRTGLGTFLDSRMVTDRAIGFTTDALRSISGVFIRRMRDGNGQVVWMRGPSGSECMANVFIDGVPTDVGGTGGLSMDDFAQPDMVAAIEVYPRVTMVPAEYLTMASGCGVVALWTKIGTGNVPVLPPKSGRR